MADDPRITPDQLKKRMGAGEDLTIIDTRKPQAWAQSGYDSRGYSHSRRRPRKTLVANPENEAGGRILYMTQRSLQLQFGAETSSKRLQKYLSL